MKKLTVAIGCDHGGFDLKSQLIAHYEETLNIVDCGVYSKDRCDYPDLAKAVCENVISNKADFGILVCTSGTGMSMCANKVNGIRCALVKSDYLSLMARKHNDANVIALGQADTTIVEAIRYCDIFLNTEFEGGRHQDRIDKMMMLK